MSGFPSQQQQLSQHPGTQALVMGPTQVRCWRGHFVSGQDTGTQALFMGQRQAGRLDVRST